MFNNKNKFYILKKYITNMIFNQELEIGEKIANKAIDDSMYMSIRLDVAIGNMLGDGSIVSYAKKNAPIGFALKLNSSHRQYIDHLYNIYKEWTTQQIYDKNFGRISKETRKPLNPCWAFDTRVKKELLIFKDWRITSGKKLEELQKKNVKKKRKTVKVLPFNIKELITPRVLAYWFMDDGSLHKENKFIIISTDSFELEETIILIDILKEKFNISSQESFIKAKNQWRIYIQRQNVANLVDVVKPYIIPCFDYKLDI